MKILIGIKTKYVGDGFASHNATDQIVIIATGELEVNRLSKLVKSFKKDLLKLAEKEGKGEGKGFCETMRWYRQTDGKIALHKKYGKKVCEIAYDHKILMITEAELI